MRRLLRSDNLPRSIILLVLVVAFGILTHGVIYSPRGILNILLQSSVVGIVAIGQTFVMLTGGVDISVAGIGVLASVFGALLLTDRPDLNIVGGNPLPVPAGIAAIIGVGVVMGALNGTLVSRLRVTALIATLGTWQIGQGLAQIIGGGYTITGLPDDFSIIGQGTIAGVPIPVIEMFLLFVIAHVVLQHTSFGRSVYAVGGNPTSSYLSGIRVQRIQFLVFVISGLMVSLAAVSIEARLMSVTSKTLRGLEIESIAAVTIGGVSIYGGRGTVIGVLLGTLILAVIDSGLGVFDATPDVENTVRGVIILLAISVEYFRERQRAGRLLTTAGAGRQSR